jgi:hypothetical protein
MINRTSLFLLLLVLACKSKCPSSDGRFAPGAIPSPRDGYTDSIFVNSTGTRVYFAHSMAATADFLGVSTGDPLGEALTGQMVAPNLDWNSDLYFVDWDGFAWSPPINLDAPINSLGNECCVWLNDDETEIIFYRDNLGLTALGPSGNFTATRADRSSPWSTPTLLPGAYGGVNQSAALYRHDIQKTTSGDLYLWEKDVDAGTSTLLYGAAGDGGWADPVRLPGTTNTQPWVSRDELTLLFNSRDASGQTKLMRASRASLGAPWGAAVEVPLNGFPSIWGEPTFTAAQTFMLFVAFDPSVPGWDSRMMYLATPDAVPYQINY